MIVKYAKAAALLAALGLAGCSAAKKAKEKAAGSLGMTISGVVKKAGNDKPIEGATVRLIKLLDVNAIKQLVEAVDVPDGKGGKRKMVRIKLDKIHPYKAAYEVKTNGSGAFSVAATPQAYLVYTFGPGAAPGEPGSYSVNFWGINPETGELDLDHLIGRNGKLKQHNDNIYLAGGPQPPPPPPTPQPEPPPPPEPPQNVPAPVPPPEPVEPVKEDPEKPEDVVPPEPDPDFWATDISVVHKNGTLDKTTPTADAIEPKDGEKYMVISAELAQAQTEPVKLVMQVGFDTADLLDCPDVKAAAKTYIYDAVPNGTQVAYKLVPPGPYYKFFLAKSATKVEGVPPSAENATTTLTVGKRECVKALPERPFLATLSWDNTADLDIHVASAKWSEVVAKGDEAAIQDQANWMRRVGLTLSLDVDDLDGYGPENLGESSAVTDPNSNCYFVAVHAYAGTFPSNAKVDIIHTTQKNGVYSVDKHVYEHTFGAQGEWWQVGVFPPGCKDEEPPPPPAAPETPNINVADCSSYPAGVAAVDGDPGKGAFYAEGTFDGKAVQWKCDYNATTRSDSNGGYYSYTPALDGRTSPRATCNATAVDGKTVTAHFWFIRVNDQVTAVSANTDVMSYPYVQIGLNKGSDKVVQSPNMYGTPIRTQFTDGWGRLDTLTQSGGKPTRAKGCFYAEWKETDSGGTGNIKGYFDLKYQ